MLSFLCHWLVIGDGEIVNLICIILRTSQLIQLAGVHIIAHTHINNTRLKRTADGLLAIFRVTTAIEAITLDAEVGTFQYCGWLGETSTEVTGFQDLHLVEGYDEDIKNMRDIYATRKFDEKRGMEKGMAKGMAKEKIATAYRLLSMGLSEAQVSTATELPLEEIQKLKEQA